MIVRQANVPDMPMKLYLLMHEYDQDEDPNINMLIHTRVRNPYDTKIPIKLP